MGVRESLAQNRALREYLHSDAAAIDKAFEERTTGTRERNRGIGLSWVRQELSSPTGRLVFHSIRGAILLEGGGAGRARNARLFPGTEACGWIPT